MNAVSKADMFLSLRHLESNGSLLTLLSYGEINLWLNSGLDPWEKKVCTCMYMYMYPMGGVCVFVCVCVCVEREQARFFDFPYNCCSNSHWTAQPSSAHLPTLRPFLIFFWLRVLSYSFQVLALA